MLLLESLYTRQLTTHAKMLGLGNDDNKSMLSESRTRDDVIAYLNREGPQDICCVIRLSIKIQPQ